MTRKWLTNDDDFKQLHSRTETLARHCSLMTPSHAQVRRTRGRKRVRQAEKISSILTNHFFKNLPARLYLQERPLHHDWLPATSRQKTNPQCFYWHLSQLTHPSSMEHQKGQYKQTFILVIYTGGNPCLFFC